MKTAFVALALSLAFSVSAHAAQSLQCAVNANFLRSKGESAVPQIKREISLAPFRQDSQAGSTTIDIGNGVSIYLGVTIVQKGSLEDKTKDLLILRTRMIRKNADGKLVVLASHVADSDQAPAVFNSAAASENISNPEIETAQLNFPKTTIADLVKLGYVPDNTVWNATTNCMYFAK